jgi:hypothetical protein
MELSGQTVIHKRYGTGVISGTMRPPLQLTFTARKNSLSIPRLLTAIYSRLGPRFARIWIESFTTRV